MDRIDAAGQTVVRHLGESVSLCFGHNGVGGDHTDGCVGAGQHGLRRHACEEGVTAVQQGLTIQGSGARQHLAGVWVNDIAYRVASDDGTHGDAIHRDGGRPDAAPHGSFETKNFAHQCTCACANAALVWRMGAGCDARGITGCSIRPNSCVSYGQVK